MVVVEIEVVYHLFRHTLELLNNLVMQPRENTLLVVVFNLEFEGPSCKGRLHLVLFLAQSSYSRRIFLKHEGLRPGSRGLARLLDAKVRRFNKFEFFHFILF